MLVLLAPLVGPATPVLAEVASWVTFLGGSSSTDQGYAVAVDGDGNVYVAGHSFATWGDGEGTVDPNPVRAHYPGNGSDVFVAKLNSSGELQWNTFLGGSGADYGKAIAVDGSGNVYVAGISNATWQGASTPVRPYTSDDDAFVARLNSDGVLQWNTFLGGAGHDQGYGITLDGSGNVYVAGSSGATWQQGDSEPMRAYSGGTDAFAAQLDGNGALQWNTFLGGSGEDSGKDIAVDGNGNAYVVGSSGATWQGASEPERAYSGGTDAFAARLDGSGALQWNTFLGGAGNDDGYGITLDGSGNVYVAGSSGATWQQGDSEPERAYSGGTDAFAAQMDGSGVLQWNTFLGGAGNDDGYGITLDGSGNVYVAGSSGATWQGDSAPVLPYDSLYDAFAAKLDNSGAIEWNTFLGGSGSDSGRAIAVSEGGSAHVAGISGATWGTPIRAFDVANDTLVVKLGGDGSFSTDVSVDIDLTTGWNMVSVPLELTDASRGAVFPPADVVAVYTWNPGAKSYEVPDSIAPEVGYWVAVTENKTITVTGTPVTTWTDGLTTGWNMCGSVCGDPVDVANLADNPSGSILDGAIYWWNPTGKSYSTADQIEEGKGYWIASTQACDLTMTGPA